MVEKIAIHSKEAPSAIGCYSQAVKTGNLVFLSGQIPLDAASMECIDGPIEVKIAKVFNHLKSIAEAAGGSLNHIVKLTVYLLDLSHFQAVNNAMAGYFEKPYPARAVVGVAALPKGVEIEIEAVMALS
jgi:reactive intermediate/imine deaminase